MEKAEAKIDEYPEAKLKEGGERDKAEASQNEQKSDVPRAAVEDEGMEDLTHTAEAPIAPSGDGEEEMPKLEGDTDSEGG